jgi:pimeloyl-ACP methyl ester carboxylesterase
MSTETTSHAVPLALDGRRIEAVRWGAEPGVTPTLVLLHEGLGSVGLWRDFPARLAVATGCGVFAYSRFGYGASDSMPLPWPLDYMRREANAVLPRVLDAAGIGDCVLIGHSDGASIAAIYAGSRQDFRVRALVLVAPHFFVESVAIAAIEATKRAYEQAGLRRRLGAYHADVDCAFRGWNNAWLDPRFAATFDLTCDLEHIRVPVLILQGLNDPYGTTAQADIAERVCHCPVRVVLLPARHAPHLEAADAALAAIASFAQRILDRRQSLSSPAPARRDSGRG